jgi:calcineurin-like phosphoesterase family protein
MSTFFTADPHFGHYRDILGRPFNDNRMDELIIRNYRRKVNPGDEVWFLGDFALKSSEKQMAYWFNALPGNKHFVLGNHDIPGKIRRLRWASVHDTHMVTVGDSRFWVSHYSHRIWPSKHHGVYHCYGHSHGNLPGIGRSLDVGVDVRENRYSPVSSEEIIDRLKGVKFEGIFHH